MRLTVSLLLVLPLALSACGKEADLKPAAGMKMPIKAQQASAAPTVETLLDRPPEAKPQREPKVMDTSEKRDEDPFDQPPS